MTAAPAAVLCLCACFTWVSGDVGVKQLRDGVRLERVEVSNGKCQWYKMDLTDTVMMNGVETEVTYAVHVEVDPILPASLFYYPKFEFAIVNGTLPKDYDTVAPKFNQLTDEGVWYWKKLVPSIQGRLTMSFGYNATAIPAGLLEGTFRKMYFMYCNKEPLKIFYDLKVTRIPHVFPVPNATMPTVNNIINSSLGDEQSQFIRLDISDFDVIDLNFYRWGNNLTYILNDEVVTNGQGLMGDLLIRRTQRPELPFDWQTRHRITNYSSTFKKEYFCTTALDVGIYYIGLFSGSLLDVEGCEQPKCEPPWRPFARAGRGNYVLQIIHTHYMSGNMTVESRVGCVSWNQWRYYTVPTGGVDNATLMVQIDGNVTGLYVRNSAPPTLDVYDSMAEWPFDRLHLSPCSLDTPTVWYIGVHLGADPNVNELVQYKIPLNTTLYTLTVQLENASSYDGQVIQPLSLGGTGYICCSSLKYYLIRDVPKLKAVSVSLNVTRGDIRAVYWKYQSCVAYPQDVVQGQCQGLCEAHFYTIFDNYHGNMFHQKRHDLQVPFGDPPWIYDELKTKRREGNWYLAVQAMPQFDAEFTFQVRTVDPPKEPPKFECNPIDRYCPKDHWHEGWVDELDAAHKPHLWVSWVCIIVGTYTIGCHGARIGTGSFFGPMI